MKIKKRTPLRISLNILYSEDTDRIIIPPGMKTFAGTGFIERYPIIYAKVVGVQSPKHKKAIQNLIIEEKELGGGIGYKAKLVAEPGNAFDPYAIQVLVDLKTNSGYEYTIGYLSKELASLLTQIRNKYSIWYTASVETIRSNMHEGDEMSFPCSARLKLKPNIEKVSTAPRVKSISVGAEGMSLGKLRRSLRRKRE